MHIYHNLFNHWIFKNFTYYKQCCNVYMCMCMCVEGEVFAYLHISAEQISRSGMLNQSILLLQDVLQKDCSDVKFFKADSQPFFRVKSQDTLVCCFVRGPKTLSTVGTSKSSSRGKIPLSEVVPAIKLQCLIVSQLIPIPILPPISVPELGQEETLSSVARATPLAG